MMMVKKIIYLFLLVFGFIVRITAQNIDSTNFSIYYDSQKEYTIAGIEVVGVQNFDSQVLVQLSGLRVGDEVIVPGTQITDAIKKLWTQALFSDVKISATKIVRDQIWLEIYLQELPRLTDVNYIGVTNSEEDDIKEKVTLLKGTQLMDNQISSAERIIKNIFLEKGFLDTEVNIIQRDDTTSFNSIILDIRVDKKEKIKINEITIHGNENVKEGVLERAMKKTKEKKLTNFFHSKKFLEDKYDEDKYNLISKYNEKGFRDATILRDTIIKNEDNTVNIELWVDEGSKYYFRDIDWVGNTIYRDEDLTGVLGINKGDIFDQTLLDKRLYDQDEGLSNVYLDNGYLFFNVSPVETNIENDSIDLEMRISEGPQATINKVTISGNTKTHEHVARRELRTYPGDLYNQSLLLRSYRELAQLGHFDPETIHPDVIPNVEDGTVDIDFQVQEKANDQIELSGGWGAGMFIGSVGLKFANFSVRNILNKEAWTPLPTGDGQTLSIRYQTSGQYYKTLSLSFIEPWLGGKKPNSFSMSISHSRVNYSANRYYSRYSSPYGYGSYSPYGYGGYSPYGYGGYSPYGSYYGGYSPYGYGTSPYTNYSYSYGSEDTDTSSDQIWETSAFAVGYGYRLSWPDDYFTIYHELSMEHYKLQNMGNYFYFLADENGQVNGTFNNASLKTTFGRSSIDNPLYTRSGSEFSLSLKITPPFSLFDNIDYSNPDVSNNKRYKWIEYHKWLLKWRNFNTLSSDGKLVLKTAFEFGAVGYFDKYRVSPFEGFILGGSGMSGYNIYGTDYVSLRGYDDYSLSPSNGSSIYSKFTMELRYPVILKPTTTIYALAFLEGGNAETNFKNYNPFKLYRSAGVGLRIYLPMLGLMGIDWGYGFDEVPGYPDANKSQIHFILGQEF